MTTEVMIYLHELCLCMHCQAVLLSYRHDARIANAADLNRRAVVSDVGMADGPLGPGHANWLVHGADDVKRCRKA